MMSISGNQWQSVAITGHHRPSQAIRGHHSVASQANSGHQRPSQCRITGDHSVASWCLKGNSSEAMALRSTSQIGISDRHLRSTSQIGISDRHLPPAWTCARLRASKEAPARRAPSWAPARRALDGCSHLSPMQTRAVGKDCPAARSKGWSPHCTVARASQRHLRRPN